MTLLMSFFRGVRGAGNGMRVAGVRGAGNGVRGAGVRGDGNGISRLLLRTARNSTDILGISHTLIHRWTVSFESRQIEVKKLWV